MAYGAIWTDALAVDPGARPNVYVNFESVAPPQPVVSADGVVFAIGVANWGPVRVAVDITDAAAVNAYLGTSPTDNFRLTVLEALKQGVRKIIFYRIATVAAAKAAVTLDDVPAADALVVTAKYEGTFGNSLKAEVVTNLVDGAKKDLNIYEGTVLRETFTGTTNTAIVADFVAKGSRYVSLATTGAADRALANIVAQPLTGGNSGAAVVASDYTNSLVAAQAATFRTLWVDTPDSSIQSSIRTWILTERNGGRRLMGVFGAGVADAFATKKTQVEALNHEGVIYAVNAMTVSGRALTIVETALIDAAAIAVSDTNSVTYRVIANATDVSPKLSPTEYVVGLTAGMLIHSVDGGVVRIESGINTLQPASQVAPKSADWRKIRYIAIQDEFVDRVGAYLGANYIGKVSNDDRGRREAVQQVQVVLDQMTDDRLLLREPRAEAYLDPRYTSDDDRVYVGVSGQAVDAIEKFFTTVRL